MFRLAIWVLKLMWYSFSRLINNICSKNFWRKYIRRMLCNSCKLKSEERPNGFLVRLVVVVETNWTRSLGVVDARIDVHGVRGGELRRAPYPRVNTFRLSIHCFSTITNCRHTLMKGSYPHWRDNRVPYASQWPFQYCQLLSPGSYMTARTLAIATIFLWLAACCGATLPDIRFSSLGIAFHRLGGGSGATPREENRLKKAIPPIFLAKNYSVSSS